MIRISKQLNSGVGFRKCLEIGSLNHGKKYTDGIIWKPEPMHAVTVSEHTNTTV